MAVDTAAKRFRMMNFEGPTAPGVPVPGDAAADARTALLWLYFSGAQLVLSRKPSRRGGDPMSGSGSRSNQATGGRSNNPLFGGRR